MRGLVLALVLVGLVAAPAGAQQEYSIMGMGASSCAKFGETYRMNPSMAEVIYFSWAQGYLSGLNTGLSAMTRKTVNLNPPEFDTDAQRKLLRRFCADNPLKNYADAVTTLLTKLRDVDR